MRLLQLAAPGDRLSVLCLGAHSDDIEIGGRDAAFGAQRSKQWFDAEAFQGLARLRGMECRAPERYAESFFAQSSL